MVGRIGARKGGRGLTQQRTCTQCGSTVSTVSAQTLCPACIAVGGLQSNTQNRLERQRSEWTPPANEQVASRGSGNWIRCT